MNSCATDRLRSCAADQLRSRDAASDMFWTCFGRVLHMCWTCFRVVLEMFRACLSTHCRFGWMACGILAIVTGSGRSFPDCRTKKNKPYLLI